MYNYILALLIYIRPQLPPGICKNKSERNFTFKRTHEGNTLYLSDIEIRIDENLTNKILNSWDSISRIIAIQDMDGKSNKSKEKSL